MVFKESKVLNIDRSGSRLTKIFHTYSRLKFRYGRVGEYVKVAVKTIERWPVRIRGKRYRPVRPGFIQRGVHCMSVSNMHNKSTLVTRTSTNTIIILKRRGVIRSPYILGPMIRPIRVKKFFYIFNHVI